MSVHFKIAQAKRSALRSSVITSSSVPVGQAVGSRNLLAPMAYGVPLEPCFPKLLTDEVSDPATVSVGMDGRPPVPFDILAAQTIIRAPSPFAPFGPQSTVVDHVVPTVSSQLESTRVTTGPGGITAYSRCCRSAPTNRPHRCGSTPTSRSSSPQSTPSGSRRHRA